MIDLTRLCKLIESAPVKAQRAGMAALDFETMKPHDAFLKMLDIIIPAMRAGNNKEMVQMYREMPIDDESIIHYFGGRADVGNLSYSDEQIEWIRENVYRNLLGEFRLIPSERSISVDRMPIEGLKVDEDIIGGKLSCARQLPGGTIEKFDGFALLKKQHYEGPYDGVWKHLAPNIQRLHLVNSFLDSDPTGFYIKDGMMHRNIADKIEVVDKNFVTQEGLERALLLMYLVSGARLENWRTLYEVVHFITKVPDSPTGYIIYLNDFDAGGNGKSKFVAILQHIFGRAFTTFEPRQLKFNSALMGKRLVHIPEFEDNENNAELIGLLKALSGRDRFQYEAKGQNPVLADSWQNFIISSNKYLYFNDPAIERRLQNFHCSNLLNHLYSYHFHSQEYLNTFFGSYFDKTSQKIMLEMSHSLLDYIQRDNNVYHIKLRRQNFVLGKLKNPILRALFADSLNTDGFIRDTEGGCAVDLDRLAEQIKPEQFNYASSVIPTWFEDLRVTPNRNMDVLHVNCPADVFARKLKEKIEELNVKSNDLKNKVRVPIELGSFKEFDVLTLMKKYLPAMFNSQVQILSEGEKTIVI